MTKRNWKPCPWCGKPPDDYVQETTRFTGSNWFSVCCFACDISGPERRTEAAAVRAWNRMKK